MVKLGEGWWGSAVFFLRQGGGVLEIFAKEGRFQRFFPWGRALGVFNKREGFWGFWQRGIFGILAVGVMPEMRLYGFLQKGCDSSDFGRRTEVLVFF